MKSTRLTPTAMITLAAVKTRGPMGWVARISGLHPEYELAREFLERSKDSEGWVHHRVLGKGLYEYRNLGEDAAAGFFVVAEGIFRLGVRLIDKELAFAMAAKM